MNPSSPPITSGKKIISSHASPKKSLSPHTPAKAPHFSDLPRPSTHSEQEISTKRDAPRLCNEAHSPIINYCGHCKTYNCQNCLFEEHMEHEDSWEDLEAKCTTYLSEYQKLLRKANWIIDIHDKHITQQSIPSIIHELKQKMKEASIKFITHIEEETQRNLDAFGHNLVFREYMRRKEQIQGDKDQPHPILQTREQLDHMVKDLLLGLVEVNFLPVMQHMEKEKLLQLENVFHQYQEIEADEHKFIQQLKKLKQTDVKYVSNPSAFVTQSVQFHDQIERPPRLLYINPDHHLIILYYISKITETVKLYVDFELPMRAVLCKSGDQTYLTGGDLNEKVLNTHYLLDELRATLVPKAPMIAARTKFGITNLETNLILVAGGEGIHDLKSACELYDANEDEWTSIPALNEKKCCCSLASSKSLVYCFGGWNEKALATLEKYDHSKRETGWAIITYAKKNAPKPREMPGAIFINQKDLLIFGGSREEESLCESFIFNIDKKTFTKRQDLEDGDMFLSSELEVHDDVVYGIGYKDFAIHTYCVEPNEWCAFSEDKWLEKLIPLENE